MISQFIQWTVEPMKARHRIFTREPFPSLGSTGCTMYQALL